MAIHLIATLDTKGEEARYVADRLSRWGQATTALDVRSLGPPAFEADISREQVFAAAGITLEELQAAGDRGRAVAAAAAGAAQLTAEAYARGEVSGVLALGGSAGTTIGTAAMRVLPLGVPKLMVSTLASGQVRPYVGSKDILMLNSVVDIAGLNRVSRVVLAEAAAAIAGMVQFRREAPPNSKPLVAATMFGVTTPCVEQARALLEAAGYEVLVFHATGSGGEAMESLLEEGLFAGVLDLTTTELADELVGGVLSAGPRRLTAAGRRGVPQVVSVGALDMVNFGPRATVPVKFADRKFHEHNASVTLMRTTPEENAELGAILAAKLAAASGPCAVLFPLRGVSGIDREGQPFHDPAARAALLAALREHGPGLELVEVDAHINDAEFAAQAAQRLLAMLGESG